MSKGAYEHAMREIVGRVIEKPIRDYVTEQETKAQALEIVNKEWEDTVAKAIAENIILTADRDKLVMELHDKQGDYDRLYSEMAQVKKFCNQCEWCNKWDLKEFFKDVGGQDVCEECKENR